MAKQDLAQLNNLIKRLSNIDNEMKEKSIDLPQPIRKEIEESISYELLITTVKAIAPNALITIKINNGNGLVNIDKKALVNELYKMKFERSVGIWDEIKYFCFSVFNGIVVYGLDELKTPIAEFKGTVEVKINTGAPGATLKDIQTPFYVSVE